MESKAVTVLPIIIVEICIKKIKNKKREVERKKHENFGVIGLRDVYMSTIEKCHVGLRTSAWYYWLSLLIFVLQMTLFIG